MPVKVTGINELKRTLKGADIRIRMAANQEIHKIATEILNESRALVPFQDGILSGSGSSPTHSKLREAFMAMSSFSE